MSANPDVQASLAFDSPVQPSRCVDHIIRGESCLDLKEEGTGERDSKSR